MQNGLIVFGGEVRQAALVEQIRDQFVALETPTLFGGSRAHNSWDDTSEAIIRFCHIAAG